MGINKNNIFHYGSFMRHQLIQSITLLLYYEPCSHDGNFGWCKDAEAGLRLTCAGTTTSGSTLSKTGSVEARVNLIVASWSE